MAEPVLTSEDRGHVRILRMNRPEKKNALSEELGWAIGDAVEAAADDDAVWVVGLTGNGSAFSSGLDLSPSDTDHNPQSPQAQVLDDLGWIGRIAVTLRERCDKLVVGGINGAAVGAGLAVAMATDVRIASDKARLFGGYARMGTSPDGGLSWTLVQALGYEKAMRFLLEQQMVGAEEALALGLVGEVVPEAQFEERFLAYCDQMAELPPIAMRQTKRMVHRATHATSLSEHAQLEIANARRGLGTKDGAEARTAFFEKRKAVYQGR